jgi:hypothetical protein
MSVTANYLLTLRQGIAMNSNQDDSNSVHAHLEAGFESKQKWTFGGIYV